MVDYTVCPLCDDKFYSGYLKELEITWLSDRLPTFFEKTKKLEWIFN